MKGTAQGTAASAKDHQSAADGAATAQGAAESPSNDVPSQAAAAQVDEMSEQEPGTFDKQAFIEAVKEAIDKAAPKNLEEADEFKDSGKAGDVKDEVQGQVTAGKEESEKDIKDAKDAPPDTSKGKPKQAEPMVNDEPGAQPSSVGAADAMPAKRPAEQTDLSAGPAEVDAKMADAEVTDEQIEKSNEPEFKGALKTRDEAKEHSKKAPAGYRSEEQGVLDKSRADAENVAGQELAGMHGSRVKALGKALDKKGDAKSADESKREQVASDIQEIYDDTKSDVTKILDDLDGKVDSAFTEGEQAARSAFESYVDKRMREYKDERYGGWDGPALWLKDKVCDLPDEVNRFYEDGRATYLSTMEGVIGDVADVVGDELTAARARIKKGRSEVQKYVAELPSELKEVGKEAEGELESEFDQLSSDVDSKQDALVDKVAEKYVEARDALDERIEELKEANKGLASKALDAVSGVVDTILKLKNMLLNVLAKAASVIGDIIADPIGFLGNLVEGVKGGLERFVSNIAGHLKQGLMGWLFGALGKAGLTMPASLDFAGILDLVLQVLGLTYTNVRSRLSKKIGEPLVAKMEQTVDVLKDFATKGIAGASEWIRDKVDDLEQTVVGEIKEFVVEKVIKAGVLWIAALLNPAAAFVKACKAIYDIVMFIVERGAEIMAFVNSVLDSVAAIAKGSVGAVVERIEGALAQALPLAISFLASLLGLGGISDKIRSIIDKVRAPINKAIDKVITGAVAMFKKLFKGPIAKAKKAKDWVKGKVDKGKAWAKDKVEGAKDRLRGEHKRSDSDPEADEAAPEPATDETETQSPISEPVRVGDQGHTLTLNPPGEGPRLEMRSTPQRFENWFGPWQQGVMQLVEGTRRADGVRAAITDIESRLPPLTSRLDSEDEEESEARHRKQLERSEMDAIVAGIGAISELAGLGRKTTSLLEELNEDDADLLKDSLGSLTGASTAAAALSVRASKYEDDAKNELLRAGLRLPRKLKGTVGLGLGLTLRPDGSVRRVYAMNDVNIKQADQAQSQKSASEAKGEVDKLYLRIRNELNDDGWEEVGGGQVTIIENAKISGMRQDTARFGREVPASEVPDENFASAIQGHEEDVIREALAGGAHQLPSGLHVTIGVPQNTICGRCVVRLVEATPEPLPYGWANNPGTEHVLLSKLAMGAEADIVVLGKQFAQKIREDPG